MTLTFWRTLNIHHQDSCSWSFPLCDIIPLKCLHPPLFQLICSGTVLLGEAVALTSLTCALFHRTISNLCMGMCLMASLTMFLTRTGSTMMSRLTVFYEIVNAHWEEHLKELGVKFVRHDDVSTFEGLHPEQRPAHTQSGNNGGHGPNSSPRKQSKDHPLSNLSP
ncbi:hypothetical protein EI94DRAFT_985376 [Lactarius quietus]|nr:hypothetical protein EI94DRAFT_985376 [Lactarius quietus]